VTPLAHRFDTVPATRSATVDGPGWGWGFRPGPGASFGEFDNRRLKGANRWRLFSGIWLVYLLPGFATAWTEHTGADRWLRLILLAAFCYVYVDPIARALTGQTRWLRWAAPTALAGLCLALLALVGPDALGTVVYVSVSVIVLWPFRIGLPVAAVGTLLVGLSSTIVPGWSGEDTWAVAGSVALGSLAAFGFQALIRRTWELRAAQQEVSRLAAERERMRIARDLHDLLGHSLTAASVKAQLAGRLVGRDDTRAAAEIGDVERLTRQVLADVRAAVAGYREVSLAVELATAREVLGAAGIAADLPGAVDEVPAGRRELFGWVVREGVTNVVRHARASRVTIRVTPDTVEVVDDGPGREARAPGSGLAGLAERAAAAGGHLDAGPVPGGGYRLALTVPPEPTAIAGLPAPPTRAELPAGAAASPEPGPAGAVRSRESRAAAGSRELRAGGAAEPADVPAVPAERPAGETAAEPEIPATPGWTAAPAPPTASRAGGGRGPGWETP
jgi:two-component system, NarL family, sensor histidine kinase DesK